jgi:predicted O-methyltransferase YrrM
MRKIVNEKGYAYLVKRSIRYVLWKVFARVLVLVAIRRLRKMTAKTDSIESAMKVAFEFSYIGMSIRPSQIKSEISELLSLVRGIEPKTVLEIGSEGGGTLFLFTKMASKDANIISIDLPEGKFGGGYPAWKSGLFKSFAYDSQIVHLIRADSHMPETLDEARKTLGGRPLDFLFIDGDHAYEGVRKDFEMYSPLVRKGGIIAFHDICPGPAEYVGGVPDFWNEISVRYRSRSIIDNLSQGGRGIGVLLL